MMPFTYIIHEGGLAWMPASSCSLLGKSLSLFDLFFLTIVHSHIRLLSLLGELLAIGTLLRGGTVVRLTVSSLIPASRIDDQSLPWGLALPRSPREEGISPSVRSSVVKVFVNLASRPLVVEFWLNGSHVNLKIKRLMAGFDTGGEVKNDARTELKFTPF